MQNPIKVAVQEVYPIVNSTIQLLESIWSCQKKLPTIDEDYVQKIPHYFSILTNDGLTPDEKIFNPQTDFKGGIDIASLLFADNMCWDNVDLGQDYRSMDFDLSDKKCLCGDYWNYRVEFFPRQETKVLNARAFITHDLILKTTVQSDKTVWEYAQNNPDFTNELIRKTCWATLYAKQTQGSHTQSEMDAFILEQEKKHLYHQTLSGLNIPFIQLIETIRPFLFNILVKHHTSHISNTEENTKKILMSDKNKIYTWAEKFGYIPNAKIFIDCQHIRDNLAHPEEFHHTGNLRLINKLQHITKELHPFLINLLQSEKFIFYFNPSITNNTFTQSIPTKNNIDAYAFSEQLSNLQNILKDYKLTPQTKQKKLNGHKKLEALATLGVIAQKDIPVLENAIKLRNDFMHGRTSPHDQQKLKNTHIATANILNNAINHHQNYIGNE